MLVILSYGVYQFNTKSDFNMNDTLSNIVGMYLTMICSCTLISTNWIFTSIGSGIQSISSLFFYCNELDYNISQISASIILVFILLCITTYYTEKTMKSEFFQFRYNEILRKDMNTVIEDLPEGVLIISYNDQEILVANKEARNLFLGTNFN